MWRHRPYVLYYPRCCASQHDNTAHTTCLPLATGTSVTRRAERCGCAGAGAAPPCSCQARLVRSTAGRAGVRRHYQRAVGVVLVVGSPGTCAGRVLGQPHHHRPRRCRRLFPVRRRAGSSPRCAAVRRASCSHARPRHLVRCSCGGLWSVQQRLHQHSQPCMACQPFHMAGTAVYTSLRSKCCEVELPMACRVVVWCTPAYTQRSSSTRRSTQFSRASYAASLVPLSLCWKAVALVGQRRYAAHVVGGVIPCADIEPYAAARDGLLIPVAYAVGIHDTGCSPQDRVRASASWSHALHGSVGAGGCCTGPLTIRWVEDIAG